MKTVAFPLALTFPALQHQPKSRSTEAKHNARKPDCQMYRGVRRE